MSVLQIQAFSEDNTVVKKTAHHKMVAQKWLLICDYFRRLLFVSKMDDGPAHDFTIFKEALAGFTFSCFRIQVDSGFTGLENYSLSRFIFKPVKASKNNPLTISQRLCNTALASVRVCVAHAIAKAKAFFSLRIEDRLKQKIKLDEAISICVGLANFKTKLATY